LNVEEADAPIAGLCLLDRNGLADQGVRHMNEAIEAEDGPSGLKGLRGGARIDLLVTDVGLPGGMNGRQMADAARVLRPGLKVLFITRLRRKCRGGERPPRPRHGGADQALRHG
jgi:CheY-like chemotaxis protein